MGVLNTLSGGPRRITELADLEGLAQPTMTVLVNQLDRQGLVNRERQADDGRVVLAHRDGSPFGYVDCGTFDCCTAYGGEGPAGPIITDAIDVATGSIAFVVDPHARGRGLGREMIRALMREPQLGFVELFEAGVDPENAASRRCLEAAGFRLRSELPDSEGMLYYRVGVLAPTAGRRA